jgi:CDP-diacylglycerol--glycerol-3-phosphate 3-phosphatidyltransferase
MNLPNRLTIARLALCAVLLLILQITWEWRGILALITFFLASMTDWLDGYLARANNQVTDFGKLMDPLADKLLVSVVYISLIQELLVPTWFVICIICREFLITGLRMLAASKGVILAAESVGKHKTVSQVFTAFLALLVLAFRDFGQRPESVILLEKKLLHPLIWITLLITMYSGLMYYIKNRNILFQETQS